MRHRCTRVSNVTSAPVRLHTHKDSSKQLNVASNSWTRKRAGCVEGCGVSVRICAHGVHNSGQISTSVESRFFCLLSKVLIRSWTRPEKPPRACKYDTTCWCASVHSNTVAMAIRYPMGNGGRCNETQMQHGLPPRLSPGSRSKRGHMHLLVCALFRVCIGTRCHGTRCDSCRPQ